MLNCCMVCAISTDEMKIKNNIIKIFLLKNLDGILYYICKNCCMRPFVAILIIISIFCFSCDSKKNADTIVYNGIVYTVNEKFDTAQAFAVSNGKIIEVGRTDDILKKYSAKEMVDAKGQAVYPGFID